MSNELREIFERRSCRDFDPSKLVTKETLSLILSAGQAGPSAKNRQPYYFVAILNQACRDKIFHAAESGRKKQFAHLSEQEMTTRSTGATGSNDQAISEASAAILVFRASDVNYSEAKDQSENLNIKEEQGVAIAAYSMMLQAEHLGLSTGWICSPLYIEKEIKQILSDYGVKCEDHWKPRVIIPIGYARDKTTKISREPLSSKSTFVA